VIDSDGMIAVKRSTYAMRVRGDAKAPVFSERIAVKQVTTEAIDMLHTVFGGYRFITDPSAIRGKPLHGWQVTDLAAHRCLLAIRPYLRIKTAQADNCIALRLLKERSKAERIAFGRGHRGAASRPEALTDSMEARYAESRRLNAVGV
jgi:hypothetical protein